MPHSGPSFGADHPPNPPLDPPDPPETPEPAKPPKSPKPAKSPEGTSDPSLERLEGELLRVVFFEGSTGYGVYRLEASDGQGQVTVVLRGPRYEAGLSLELTGRWQVHPEHGRQFVAQSSQRRVDTSPEGRIRELMQYPGIGEASAGRIVETLGLEAVELLDQEPRRWLRVDGIGERTLQRVLEFHRTRVGPLAELERALAQADLPLRYAAILHHRYGERAMGMLQHHPYDIAREVKGIGFGTADALARGFGLDREDPRRIKAGILHLLQRATREGHCALDHRTLMQRGSELLSLSASRVAEQIDIMVKARELVEETLGEEVLYFEPELWSKEYEIAAFLLDLAGAERPLWSVGDYDARLSEGQRQAVAAVAEHGVVILTGGPGTGKSTVVAEILQLAQEHGQEVTLAAPTGRAAKRLEQTTGQEAQTLHRLLEIAPDKGGEMAGSAVDLPAGLVVVDEVSMLDVSLAHALLRVLGPQHRLLLVGDADQLPSVGPGNVLSDLLFAFASEDRGESPVKVVRLTKIFRQAQGSSIVVNAHRVLSAAMPEGDKGPEGQFFLLRASSAPKTRELIEELVLERIPKAYGLDPATQIQVLSPMHRGEVGITSINQNIAARLTGDAAALEFGEEKQGKVRRFAVGDRVMQNKNDYERGVFNGDVGRVRAVFPATGCLSVEMGLEGEDAASGGGFLVRYERSHLAHLQLAYAVSIHKSQGNEFPAVVIPLVREHRVMLQRNLLYTAMTRAERLCILVGEPAAIQWALQTTRADRRFTGLGHRLRRMENAEERGGFGQ